MWHPADLPEGYHTAPEGRAARRRRVVVTARAVSWDSQRMRQLHPAARAVALVAALATLTVGMWWVWLGSDTEYRFDPATQTYSGPYEAAQVIACVLSLIVLAVAGALLLPPSPVVVTMTAAFATAWSINAAANDVSGLWGVGAMLLVFGMVAGTTVVVMATQGLRRLLRR